MGDAARSGNFSFYGFLEVKNSAECKELRAWLQNASSLTNREVEELRCDFRNRAISILGSNIGTMTRYGIGKLCEKVPVLGPFLGYSFGKLTSCFLRGSGPVLFLNNKFPSIFR